METRSTEIVGDSCLRKIQIKSKLLGLLQKGLGRAHAIRYFKFRQFHDKPLSKLVADSRQICTISSKPNKTSIEIKKKRLLFTQTTRLKAILQPTQPHDSEVSGRRISTPVWIPCFPCRSHQHVPVLSQIEVMLPPRAACRSSEPHASKITCLFIILMILLHWAPQQMLNKYLLNQSIFNHQNEWKTRKLKQL